MHTCNYLFDSSVTEPAMVVQQVAKFLCVFAGQACRIFARGRIC